MGSLSTAPHPLSGAAKTWAPPDFSLEARRQFKRVSSVPVPYVPPLQQHPDEEKGRSLRSATRIPSTSTLFAGRAPADDVSMLSAFVETELGLNDEEDDKFLAGYAQEQATLRVNSGVVEVRPSETAQEEEEPVFAAPTRVEMVDWTKLLEKAVETADGDIELRDRRLTRVPDAIWELSTLRSFLLPNSRPRRSFERNAESTPSLTFSKPSRSFGRTSSGSLGFASPAPSATAVPLTIDLAKNELSANSLSNALWGLSNLRYLFLRHNQLEHLPEGIGRLPGLVELSLAGNQLRFLPAEILQLEKLTNLTLHPNPFIAPPTSTDSPATTGCEAAPADSEPRQRRKRLLGPLTTHFTVPSLKEITIRQLLAIDPFSKESKRIVQRLEGSIVRQYLSAEHLFAPFHTTFHPYSSASSSSLPFSISAVPFARGRHPSASSLPGEAPAAQPFDPLAHVCRSPHHAEEERFFYEHAVERIEWVCESSLKQRAVVPTRARVGAEARTIPIRWRGCGPRCLDWLEEDDEDEDEDEPEEMP
ncbi:hypothetical protein JCM21900_004850 [Sporobolomyces salmonicolor]